jgi:hypothetical protein
LRILAALSHSLSRVVGQKASDPILFESLLTGAPTEELSVLHRRAIRSFDSYVCLPKQRLCQIPSCFQSLSGPKMEVSWLLAAFWLNTQQSEELGCRKVRMAGKVRR